MLKKDSEIKWIFEAKASFEQVKEDIRKAPILVSSDYTLFNRT